MRHTAPAVNSPPVSSHRHLITGGKKQKKEAEEQLPRNKIKAARLAGWMDGCVCGLGKRYTYCRWVVLVRATRANATCTCLSFDKKGRKQKKKKKQQGLEIIIHTHTQTHRLFSFFLFLYVRLLFIWISLSLKFPISNLSLFFSSSLYERDKTTKCFLFFVF